MKKTYILDTNVILHDCTSIFKFEENNVVIPITVLEELDHFKKDMNELGRNARHFSKIVDDLRETGSLLEGVKLNSDGGKLKIALLSEVDYQHLPKELDLSIADNKILAVAYTIKGSILVSKDTNMRIKADAMGIPAENYENDCIKVDELYTGVFYSNSEDEIPPQEYLFPNQYIVVKDAHTGIITKEGRYDKNLEDIVPLREDLTSWGLEPINEEQRYLMDLLLNDEIKLVTVSGKAGCGKAQPLDALVLTPTGFTKMGNISTGDYVVTPEGKYAVVLAEFPQGSVPIYKVTFSDGTSTECCDEHLWMVKSDRDRNKGLDFRVLPLKDIRQKVIIGEGTSHARRNWSVPMVSSNIDFQEEAPLPLHPYVLGALIGDGGMSQTFVNMSSADEFIIAKLSYLLMDSNIVINKKSGDNYDYGLVCAEDARRTGRKLQRVLPDGRSYTYSDIRDAVERSGYAYEKVYDLLRDRPNGNGEVWSYLDRAYQHSTNKVKDVLMTLGLQGKLSHEKFVPNIYKITSASNRLELLQGLMDTDGTIGKSGHACVYYTTSPQLADDVKFLVESLGGKAVVCNKQTSFTHKNTKKLGKPSYAVHISMPPNLIPVTLPRKLERFKPRTKYTPTRYIDSVEYVGCKEAKCILIDAPSHLYVTNNFIVTHNTLVALSAALRKVTDEFVYRKLLVSRPVFPMGKDIGFLPGEISDKLSPYMQPIRDNVEFLVSGSVSTVKLAGKKRGKKSKEEEEKEAGLLGNGYAELEAAGIMELEPLLYIRGRSIPNVIMIVDEAQNLTPHEAKTIVTRAGKGTKLIFTGDVEQVDATYLDSTSNGLAYLIEKFKDQKIAAHISLQKSERSELAEIAGNIL